MKKVFFVASILLLVMMFFVGCNDVVANNNKNGEKVDGIRIELNVGGTRQIMPTAFSDDVTYKLSETHGSTSYEKEFSAYTELSNTKFSFEEGEWNFTLSLVKDKVTIATSSITATISQETSVLTFEFKTGDLNYSSGTGSINVKFIFPASGKITKITAGLYDSITSTNATATSEFSQFTDSGSTKFVTYTAKNIASGSHYVIFNVYQNTEIIAKGYEFVYVANETLSNGECKIENLNEIYTIEYVLNGIDFATGFTAPASFNKSQNITLPVLANFDKTKLTFTGWYESENFSGDAITGWKIDEKSSDVKVYAKNTATVTFIMNGYGTSVASQSVIYNEKTTKPTTPADSAMIFSGWYSDSGLTQKFSFNTAITSNISLYAKWITEDELETYEYWSYPTSTPSLTWTGKGTSRLPYIIETAQQLADLSYMVNYGTNYKDVYFALGDDIDLNENIEVSEDSTTAKEWRPIGNNDLYSFNGTFDGAGHTIDGLYINSENYIYAGLFGYVSGGTIKNLKIGKGYISNNFSTVYSYTGAIAGCIASVAEVISCGNENTPVSDTGRGYSYVGGLVGYSIGYKDEIKYSIIRNSYNKATVNGYKQNSSYVGGIAGYIKTYSSIYNCSNTGNVTGYVVGGICGGTYSYGKKETNYIRNSYNTGSISGVSYTGGIVGEIGFYSNYTYNYVNNSYNRGDLSSSLKGGIVGECRADFSYSYLYIQYCYYHSATATSYYVKIDKDCEKPIDVGVGSFTSAISSVSDGYVTGGTLLQNLNAWVNKNNSDNEYSNWKEDSEGWPILDFE